MRRLVVGRPRSPRSGHGSLAEHSERDAGGLADRPQRGTERLWTVLELWNFGITADMPREITDS
ncbi:MAG: hypothetical protein ACJ76T_01670, partial [Solirubrobacteraceae bacterium]